MSEHLSPITESQQEQIKALFYQSRFQPPSFEFSIIGGNRYCVEVSQMYNYVEFVEPYSALSGWLQVAKILGCENGDEYDRMHYGGCETCDYGSSYEVTWHFW